MKKVLLATAKWPLCSSSTDGGDVTVSDIVKALGAHCELDLLCFRMQESDEAPPFVNKLIFYEDDFAQYEYYSKTDGTKFNIRLEQAVRAGRYIESLESGYDVIIIVHCMFLLGLSNKEVFGKTVLFPMFTGSSYALAGDNVTENYLAAEHRAIPRVRMIISPSMAEKEALVEVYRVNPEKIRVIPRFVKALSPFVPKKLQDSINVVYIASVRIQKAHMDAMRLVRILNSRGIHIMMNCVGSIQDAEIYNSCLEYSIANGIQNQVAFHGTLPPEKMAEIFEKNDINVSVSNWETFGRGIYEGMAHGLPTVVLSRLKCVSEAANIGVYPTFAKDINEMADMIEILCTNPDFYHSESLKGEVVAQKLSYENTNGLLCLEILEFGGNGV